MINNIISTCNLSYDSHISHRIDPTNNVADAIKEPNDILYQASSYLPPLLNANHPENPRTSNRMIIVNIVLNSIKLIIFIIRSQGRNRTYTS